jgi:hypothetical protein
MVQFGYNRGQWCGGGQFPLKIIHEKSTKQHSNVHGFHIGDILS